MHAEYGELHALRSSTSSSSPRSAARQGRGAIRHYIISHTEEVSDLLEVLVLQKECGLFEGLLAPLAPGHRGAIVVPLFETIGDLRRCEAIMREFYALPASPTGRWPAAART